MNKVVLIGRLTKDPDLKYTQSGKAVCNFTLAVNRPFKSSEEQQDADFFNIVVWNKVAENTAQYMAKGKQCAVEGRLQIRNYRTDTGEIRYITEIVANSVEFLGGRNEQNGARTKEVKEAKDSDFYQFPEGAKEVNIPDADLPF